MIRIAVIGVTGLLGHMLTSYLEKCDCGVVRVSRREFNIETDDFSQIEPYLDGADYIINCAGIIKPLIQYVSVENVLRVNTVFPQNLAVYSRKTNSKCIHISTDCVYSGTKGKYTERDPYDARDVYGMSKVGGESGDLMVLRTSIIGPEKYHTHSLLEWAKSRSGTRVDGYLNHYWNGLTTLYLSEVILNIMMNGEYRVGTFHIHSPDVVSKFQLLEYFNEIFRLNLTITPVNSPEFCDRSLSSLDKLSSKYVIKTIFQQVAELA